MLLELAAAGGEVNCAVDIVRAFCSTILASIALGVAGLQPFGVSFLLLALVGVVCLIHKLRSPSKLAVETFLYVVAIVSLSKEFVELTHHFDF